MQNITSKKGGLVSLSPLFVFIALYFTTSIISGDFYKMPISVAFLLTGIYAVGIGGGRKLKTNIEIFGRGASKGNIMLMLWIFIMAGAFANSAKEIGSIDATVSLMLSIMPDSLIVPSLFLSTCLISMSIGTSVGTIMALVPIAAGLAESTGMDVAMMTGVVVGGAFFGDNLSFISDTTIAATNSQECSMSDKFRVNIFITVPAAMAILCLYTVMGFESHATVRPGDAPLLMVLPYIVVLATAIMGVDVFVILTLGIALTGVIGICTATTDVYGWLAMMGSGIMSMGELVIITMLAGGIFEIVRRRGGIDYIINGISRRIHGKRMAETVIGALVATVDLCTANNTVAIISVGNIARQISQRFGLDNRKAACLLDTCSCCIQGILPYGAQLLLAGGLAGLSPVQIIPYTYYNMALAVCVALSIIFRYPRRYS